MSTKLSTPEIVKKLETLEGWAYSADRNCIYKSFQFINFSQTWGVMTRIALHAEKMDHHPDWSNVYNRLEIQLSTHSVGGVSDLDFMLAAEINKIVG